MPVNDLNQDTDELSLQNKTRINTATPDATVDNSISSDLEKLLESVDEVVDVPEKEILDYPKGIPSGQRWITDDTHLHVSLENIGGISSAEYDIPPGITLFVGENATNRTSIIEGIGAAVGANTGSLKTDSEEGTVRLDTGDAEFLTKFSRNQEASLTDPSQNPVNRHHELPFEVSSEFTAALTHFMVLNQSNVIRHSIRSNTINELRDIIMSPVPTSTITDEINRLETLKSELTTKINQLDREKDELQKLEENRIQLQDEIEVVSQELEQVEQEIESYELDRDEAQEHTDQVDEYESLLDEKKRLENELDQQQSIRKSTEERLKDAETELEELSVNIPGEYDDIDAIEHELERIRGQKEELNRVATELRNLSQTTRTMLDSSDQVLAEFRASDEVTDQLDPDRDELQCWTCGGTVKRSAIEDRNSRIRQLAQEKDDQVEKLNDKIEHLTELKRQFQNQKSKQQSLQQRVQQLEDELEDIESTIDNIESKIRSIANDIETLETEIEASDTSETVDALLEAHQRRGSLQAKRSQLESELEDVEQKIESIDANLEMLSEAKTKRGILNENLTELRTLIDDIEQSVVEGFNERMEHVLELLEYDNLARVWIERKHTDNQNSIFDIHVVRETDDGTVYEDTLGHLSESEREVIGLIIGITGYIEHNVGNWMPIILLDAIEAIDPNRINQLVEYIMTETETTHLIAALFEEYAEACPESVTRIQPTKH